MDICQQAGQMTGFNDAFKNLFEAARLYDLGLSCITRFEQLGDVKDTDEAIKHFREAVRLTPVDIPARPMYLSKLGFAFMRRFQWFGVVKDADEAINIMRDAVRLTPLDDPELPSYLGYLGSSLLGRFERLGQ
jgi:hypothetical protein